MCIFLTWFSLLFFSILFFFVLFILFNFDFTYFVINWVLLKLHFHVEIKKKLNYDEIFAKLVVIIEGVEEWRYLCLIVNFLLYILFLFGREVEAVSNCLILPPPLEFRSSHIKPLILIIRYSFFIVGVMRLDRKSLDKVLV